jgi:hypothetical protein
MTFINQPEGAVELGEIPILKLDEAGNCLGGATFKVEPNPYGGDELLVTDNEAPDVDPEDGIILLVDVPAGSYSITEVEAPPGYQLSDAVETWVVGSLGAKSFQPVTFINEPEGTPELGEIPIIKLDEAGTCLGGATFKVEPNPYDDTEDYLLVTDNDDPPDVDPEDGIILLVDVPVGTYQVTEVEAPEGYLLDPTVQTWVIGSLGATSFQPMIFVNELEDTQQVVQIPKAIRDLPAVVDPGVEFDVGIQALDYGGFFGGVVETLPEGFTYVSSSLDPVCVLPGEPGPRDVTFIMLGDNVSFTYRVQAPEQVGTYYFHGILTDSLTEPPGEWEVDGDYEVTVGWSPLLYDENGNGIIDKAEAVQAILDFFGGLLSKDEVIEVIVWFFGD